MVNGIMRGEFIDDEIKQDMSDRLTTVKRIGLLADYNILYKRKNDKKSA